MSLSEETIALIQQAAMDLSTPGIEVWDSQFWVGSDESCSIQSRNLAKHYLKIVAVDHKSWKVIPVNNSGIVSLGQTVNPLDSERWDWYLVTTPEGDFGLSHWIFEGRDFGLKILNIESIPAYLMAALARGTVSGCSL